MRALYNSLQEVFDKAAGHMLTQGCRSQETEEGPCRYRLEVAGETLSCGVGCLIPDEVYDPAMEGRSASVLLSGWNVPDTPSGFPQFGRMFSRKISRARLSPLLTDLQRVHDTAFPYDWEDLLRAVARRHDLEFTPDMESCNE